MTPAMTTRSVMSFMRFVRCQVSSGVHAFLEHGVVLADERRFARSGERAVHEEPQESEEQPHFKETKMVVVEHGARNDEQVHVHKVGDEIKMPTG